MGLSSRSDLVIQHEPEEEKIDRQTDRHGGVTKSQDNSGEATSKDSFCGVWERGQAGGLGDALSPAFHSASPGVLETGGAFSSPVKVAGGTQFLSCAFLCFPDVWCLLLLSYPTQQRLLRYWRDISLLLRPTAKGEVPTFCHGGRLQQVTALGIPEAPSFSPRAGMPPVHSSTGQWWAWKCPQLLIKISRSHELSEGG